MKLKIPALAASLLAILLFNPPARADDGDVTADQIQQAIQKGAKYILGQMQNGNWESTTPRNMDDKISDLNGAQWGGRSALCTYALLASGQSNQDPQMQAAINWLVNAPIDGTYALAMRCQMYPYLNVLTHPKPVYTAAIERDTTALVSRVKQKPAEAVGFFNYTSGDYRGPDPTLLPYDHSVSQYGVLGLWALNEVGGEIPAQLWQQFDDSWREHATNQGNTAFWGYQYHKDAKPSMTAAGIATLFITKGILSQGKPADCNGSHPDALIDAALLWMSQNWKGDEGMYCLYGIERIGVASGYKYFGDKDWFKLGSKLLIQSQQGDGHWGNDGDHDAGGSLGSTSLAMLFLCRGSAPVIINKLQYDIFVNGDNPVPSPWNERQRDVANFTHWLGIETESFLNWQIVNLRAPVDDLFDAPILYISGNHELSFSPDEIAKLKTYVEQGGIILGNADCGSPEFTASFIKLGHAIAPTYEFRELEPGHVIYTNEQFHRKDWKNPPSLQGLSNGARELMLLFPNANGNDDPSRYWQMQVYFGHEELHDIGSDIVVYAVDKINYRLKGDTYVLHPDNSSPNNTAKVARIQYAGNWDPEPGGWKRLAAFMHNKHSTNLDVQTVDIRTQDLSAQTYPMAHLTGTDQFSLNADIQQKLVKYVNDGGTLVIDDCGGASNNSKFAESADQLIAAMFPAAPSPLPVIAPGDPVYSASETIGRVGFRPFAKKLLGNLHDPQIRGYTLNGRIAVFYSKEDLSASLVGESVDGIDGYIGSAVTTTGDNGPETTFGATEIMNNIVAYANKNHTPP